MSHDSHSHGHGGHGGHDAHDIQKTVRRYLMVFGALLVGTILTVCMYYVYFENPKLTIGVALVIASVKAFLVAGYFMHLISERKMIYSLMAATVFCFAGLMYITLWSMNPTSLIHWRW